MKGNLNQEIKQFIDDMPDNYGFSKDDAKYISRYSGCEVPPFIFNDLIQEMVKEHYPFISVSTTSEPVNALCYGYGSLAVLSNTNVHIKCFQEDYYCYRVTQALHYDAVSEGEQSVTFRNLADYFMDYKGNNRKNNIVVVFPHASDYHTIVDSDPAFTGLSSYAYYTLRGAYFLKNNGVLISLVPKQYGQEILSNKDLLKELHAVVTITYEGDYAIVKITK